MPLAGTYLAYAHLAEGEEKHGEYQYGLNKVDCAQYIWLGRRKEWYIDIYKIKYYSHEHGYGQCPVLDKTNDTHNTWIKIMNGLWLVVWYIY